MLEDDIFKAREGDSFATRLLRELLARREETRTGVLGTAIPSIAQKLSVGEEKVRNALERLVSAGFIDKMPVDGTTEYLVLCTTAPYLAQKDKEKYGQNQNATL